MNKKFVEKLERRVEGINDRLNDFYKKNGDDFAEYSESDKRWILQIEEELSTVKWVRDLYLEMEEQDDEKE